MQLYKTLRKTALEIILTCSLPFSGLFSQNNSAGVDLQEVYQNQRQQIILLQTHHPVMADSLTALALQEADLFAESGDYEMALQLLEELSLSPLWEDESAPAAAPMLPTLPAWDFQMEAGSDYSRQEYEMSLLENDSVVVEQLTNPYISLRANRSIYRETTQMQFFGFGRADRELLEGSISGAVFSTTGLHPWRLEAQSSLYYYRQESASTFLDSRLFGQIYRPAGEKNRILLEGTLRGKLFSNGKSDYANLWDGDFLAQWQRRVNLKSNWRFSLEPGFYSEEGADGFQYLQTGAELEFEYRATYNHFAVPALAAGWRRFTSSADSTDYRNTFYFLRPAIDTELPFSRKVGIAIKGQMEWRQYTNDDPNYSDYLRNQVSILLKRYFGDYNSIGLGFYYEDENHFSNQSDLSELVDIYDYHAPGVIFTADIIRENGLLLSLHYTYGTKTFPHGQASDLAGFYSNRRIHSIQGFGLLPITASWQFQFFINYDDDRDREQEFNDNFSTIFNAGIIYKF